VFKLIETDRFVSFGISNNVHGRQSWGFGGRDPSRFWAGGRGKGSQGVVDGSGNIIISCHVQEVYSKVVTFE